MTEQICRLCGEHQPLPNLSTDINDMSVKSKLASLNIDLEIDKYLPTYVCCECAGSLEMCTKFVQNILDVQDKLKAELLEPVICDNFEHFELQIERVCTDEAEKSIKKYSERNRGIKMRRDVLKYTMNDLFQSELTEGKFTSEIEQIPSEYYNNEVTKSLGWFNYEWKCNGCNGIFANVMDLEKHSMKCIRKRCMNSCNLCQKEFSSYSTFLNHVVDRHQQLLKFSCIICSEFRPNILDLFHHATDSHSDYSVFFCLYCGKYFFTGALLRDHLIVHRPEIVLPEFNCDICGFKTHRKQMLLSHMSRFHLERRFTCECCAFSFKYRAELIQHQQSQHSDECNEECKICGKTFKNKRKLRRHVRNMHEETGVTFTCEECGKVSKNRKAHKTHMKIHSDKEYFQCTYCPRTFKHSSGFKYHLRIHTGEKPYVCPICDQKFIDWPNCKKHIRANHGLNDIKPTQLLLEK